MLTRAPSRALAALLGLAGLLTTAPPVRAADPRHVANARAFLARDQRTRDLLGAMHTGTTPGRGTYRALFEKVNVGRVEKAGYFAIEMRYTWQGGLTGNGETDVQFFFDNNGRLFDLRAVRSNAALVGPFEGANLVIAIIKDVIKDLARGDRDEMAIRRLVDACGDARQLILLQFKLEQALGK
jgi:hypothetical protein